MTRLIEEYSIPVRMAKEVFERGEFISLASCDMMTQPNRLAFLNRIRRIDGEEFHYLSDIRGAVNLVHLLIGRLLDSEKQEFGKQPLNSCKADLLLAQEKLNQLMDHLS